MLQSCGRSSVRQRESSNVRFCAPAASPRVKRHPESIETRRRCAAVGGGAASVAAASNNRSDALLASGGINRKRRLGRKIELNGARRIHANQRACDEIAIG